MISGNELLAAILLEGSREEFAKKHGEGFAPFYEAFEEAGGALDPSASIPERARWVVEFEKRLRAKAGGARWLALCRLHANIVDALRDPDIRADPETTQLVQALANSIASVVSTDLPPLEAFADVFAGAHGRVAARKRATDRHAAKREILARAWLDVKKGAYGSAKACAEAYARHYGAEGGPRASTLLKHFAAMANKEGIKLPRGPRAKRA